MINVARLSTAEAAAMLGVKPETLYAYVSRGILSRDRSVAGGSTYDAVEVARLARRSRRGATQREPGFVTGLTLIEGGRLYYRGLDAVELSRSRTFEEVAGWLWAGEWLPSGANTPWEASDVASAAVRAALSETGSDASPVERFVVAAAVSALTDELRHDLSPGAVSLVGRRLVATLVDALPTGKTRRPRPGRDQSVAGGMWPRLSRLALTAERRAVIDSALVLCADHELAPSTLAARVAASFRADPYAVVCTGLGPASGSWEPGSTGAPGEVEALLAEAQGSDAGRAIGERLRRRGGAVHGFGMPLYPDGDPRGSELLSRLGEIGGDPARLEVVQRVIAIGVERGFPPPNVDLALGALSFCAEMTAGAAQGIATLGKVVGWLAHAMEEYANPTRFRARAVYVGPAGGSDGDTETAWSAV